MECVHLTGDEYGIDESRSPRVPTDVTKNNSPLTEMMARITSPHAGKRLKEKLGSVRIYFGSKE